METINIGYGHMVLGFLLLIIPTYFLYRYRTGLVKDTLWAALRMTVQLFFIGFYLEYLFLWDNLWINLLWVVLMIVIASSTVLKRTKLPQKMLFMAVAVAFLVSLLIINVLAFAVAYVLTKGIKGSNIFRTVFFMPNLIGGIVLGYIWLMIFDGILSHFDTAVVLETKYGFWGLIILMCWQQIGYMMIIYIAGLQAIPEDMLEAAKIDGASGWKTLWHITIPNVMPSITICTFLSLTNGFKLYDQNLALTGGSPFKTLADGSVIKTTEMLALNIVNSNTSNSKGPGQAKAVVFFVLVAIISIAQLVATRKKEVDQ